eukprot:m.868837 g.868837  ORF g.868837 m.868837 type:complete len:475 (+) comp59739_c0_seq37:2192-3616(+)
MGCCEAGSSVAPAEGEKQAYDPNFQGPLRSRSCTDCLFLLLFIASWAGMAAIAGLALRDGDPARYYYGADIYGNVCGRSNDKVINEANSGLDMSDRPYLYYFDVTTTAAVRLCVAACPSAAGTAGSAQAAGLCLDQSPYTLDAFQVGLGHNIDGTHGCPSVYVATTERFHRCVPDDAESAFEALYGGQADGIWANLSSDFTHDWKTIVYLCLIAAGVSFVVLLLMRCIAPVLIWIVYFGTIIVLCGTIGYLWYMWKRKKDAHEEDETAVTADTVKTFFIAAIVVSSVAGLVLVVVLVMYKRVRLVVALFKEASAVLLAAPFLVFTPIWTYILLLGLIIYIVLIYIYLYSIATISQDANKHAKYTREEDMIYAQAYHIFGFFWTSQVFSLWISLRFLFSLHVRPIVSDDYLTYFAQSMNLSLLFCSFLSHSRSFLLQGLLPRISTPATNLHSPPRLSVPIGEQSDTIWARLRLAL